VNTNLRNAFVTSEVDGFLPAPWHKEFGQWATIWCEDVGSGAGKRHYIDSAVPRYPISKLEHHIDKKLLAFDGSRDDFRKLIGVPLGEYYHINPDYKRQNHTKPLFTLGEEYSCCNGCKEKFPTRVKYSEQSFQEEITDNYRKF